MIADVQADKAIAAVPAALKSDPGLVFSEIQKLRRADKIAEAAALMRSAPRNPALLVDPDEWWTERRVLARKVLDTGDAATAYAICADHSAVSHEAKVDAEFHAGWIALRFLNDPKRAAAHFATAAKLTETPTSVARIAYWQGRAAESTLEPDAVASAKAFYRAGGGERLGLLRSARAPGVADHHGPGPGTGARGGRKRPRGSRPCRGVSLRRR